MQRPRMQQTMPGDRSGWYKIDAGPHLEVLFHPNRQLAAREPDQIERPSIVVRWPASASRRFASIPSVWAPTSTSGRALPIRYHSRSQMGKVRSMPRWPSLKSRFGSGDS